MNKNIHIILDYGHGKNCPGKCSPDKSFYEWQFNREIGKAVFAKLKAMGYNVHETWAQDHEPLSNANKMLTKTELNAALNWRAKEVNRLCSIYGKENCISISIHSNAAGSDGKWHTATGFCVFVGKRASSKSKHLARCIYDEADKQGLSGNRSVPKERYWVKGLAMCDSTHCPAVLTESLFYDSQQDLAILKSQAGKAKIVQLHIDGIIKYVEA